MVRTFAPKHVEDARNAFGDYLAMKGSVITWISMVVVTVLQSRKTK